MAINLRCYVEQEQKTCNNTFTQHLLCKIGFVVARHDESGRRGSIGRRLVLSQKFK